MAINAVFHEEPDEFNPPTDNAAKTYWAGYTHPDYPDVANGVDLYRVAFRSPIQEQGNRPTVAYGLVAIPKGATGTLPLLSYQHGTLCLKESAPSQAFSWNKNDTTPFSHGLSLQPLYGSCYETRLNVAQFAGNGYAVVVPDYIGIGNSVEHDSFFVKGSEQRACLDMYAAAQKLLAHENLWASQLFLSGRSQGGFVMLAFQEALEAKGVKVADHDHRWRLPFGRGVAVHRPEVRPRSACRTRATAARSSRLPTRSCDGSTPSEGRDIRSRRG